MLPKKIPPYVLILIWLAGTVPYFVIEFWLSNIPAVFHGADNVGSFVADSSLAFSTAFPFWFVVEWFTRRSKRAETARVQRAFLDDALRAFNHLVHRMSTAHARGNWPEPLPDHAFTLTNQESERRIKEFVAMDNAERADGSDRGHHARLLIHRACRRALAQQALISPYQGDFSLAFNMKLQEFMFKMQEVDEMDYERLSSEKDPLGFMLFAYNDARHDLLQLENIYRKEHSIRPLVHHPNGPAFD